MKLFSAICFVALVSSTAAAPSSDVKRQDGSFNGLSFKEIDNLTPPFGHKANVNPTGTGDCDGAINGTDGKPIKIPCTCPPNRTTFINDLIENLNAGHVVNNSAVGISFPKDNSTSSIRARFNAATVTLQNLNGPGKGCPQAATTWAEQLKNALEDANAAVTAPAGA